MIKNILNDRFINAFEQLEKLKKISSKAQFARDMGISPQTLSEILKKRQGVSTEIMNYLFEKYNVSYDFIFKGIDPLFKIETTNYNLLEEPQVSYSSSSTKDELIVMQRKLIEKLEAEIVLLKRGDPVTEPNPPIEYTKSSELKRQ